MELLPCLFQLSLRLQTGSQQKQTNIYVNDQHGSCWLSSNCKTNHQFPTNLRGLCENRANKTRAACVDKNQMTTEAKRQIFPSETLFNHLLRPVIGCLSWLLPSPRHVRDSVGAGWPVRLRGSALVVLGDRLSLELSVIALLEGWRRIAAQIRITFLPSTVKLRFF